MLWVLLFLVAYPYIVYPLVIRMLAILLRRDVAAAPIEPTATIIIAAHNEADVIAGTIRNKLEQDYPEAQLSLIVVSDASDDGTDDIVERLAQADSRVRLIRQQPRQGKTAALNRAMAITDSEIVVFSDANSHFAPDAVRQLIESFADDTVGYATGTMTYTDSDGTPAEDGGSTYMDYENRLRTWETAVGSVVGVDGGIDAVRHELYRPMQADQLPDFVLPLNVVEQGYRVVYAPEAELREAGLRNDADELRMRTRVALRALWALWDKRGLLNPVRFPLFAWQLASHKLLRYLSVLPLIGAAIVAFSGANNSRTHLMLSAVFIAGGAAALLGTLGSFRQFRVLRLAHYFAIINLANLRASIKFLRGEKIVVWSPRLG